MVLARRPALVGVVMTANWFLIFCLGFVLGAAFAWFALQEVPWHLLEK
jgi:hypothetical protein